MNGNFSKVKDVPDMAAMNGNMALVRTGGNGSALSLGTEVSSSTNSNNSRHSYTIKANDTLSAIAQRELGDANRWHEITKENGQSFSDTEAKQLAVGQVVYLPGGDNSDNQVSQPISNNVGAASQVSDAGLKFISKYEGLSLQLYNDPAGNATIGVGHLVHSGSINGTEPAEFRNGSTEKRAFELLRDDANSAIQAVKDLVKVGLNQFQFDALVSFVFNEGRGQFAGSDLLTRLNSGEYDAVPSELNRWVYAGGQKLPGLVRRRADEGNLFKNGIYS